MSLEEDLQKAREKLSKTPVNKATEKERGRLKAKIANIQEKMEKRQKETGGGYEGYSVQKKGDATVSLVGYPSVGKSTLLNKLTNADSEVGDYHFTTLDVVPGMMEYKGANIQLVDVPGLIGGAATDKGGGKQVISVIRNSDMVVLMSDPSRLDGFQKMNDELYNSGIRLDVEPPNIKVEKKGKGGIDVRSAVDLTKVDEETVKDVMEQWGYVNASIIIREDCGVERVIDALARNRKYMPSLKVVNKSEKLSEEEKEEIREEFGDVVFVSAKEKTNMEEFKEKVYEGLNFMRIYMKKPGKDPDREEPLIIEKGSTVGEVCEKVGGELESRFKYARIWGDSAKFDEQKVGEDHVLKDEDVVEIRKR